MVNVSLTHKMDIPTVAEASAAAERANEQYNEYCEKFPTDYKWQNTLRTIANEADRLVWLAREAKLNECYCSTRMEQEGLLCNVCKAQMEEHYPEIPWKFGGQP